MTAGRSGLIDEYRYGRRTGITVSPGASMYDQHVHLAAVPFGSIAGSVSAPEGYAVALTRLSAAFREGRRAGAAWPIGPVGGPGATFGFATPELPDATFAITARATAGAAYSEAVVTGLPATAGDVVLGIPPAPVHAAPQDAAIGVDFTTEFSWRRAGDAVYLLAVRYAGEAEIIPSPPNVYLFTTDTTATLPDPGVFAMPFLRGTGYVWEVRSYAPVQSVDDIMDDGWFLPDADGSTGYGGPRLFRFVD